MTLHRWHGSPGLLPGAVQHWLPQALAGAGAGAALCALVHKDRHCLLAMGEVCAGGGEAVGPQHAFHGASLAKAAVSLVAAQAAERGLLDLDAAVGSWLPNWQTPPGLAADRISLDHLLGNCSGMAPVWPLDEMLGPHLPVDEVLARMAALRVVGAPGEQFEYLNLGFVAAARAIEIASGRPYAELLQEWVFRPLGMPDSASAGLWHTLGARRVRAHGGTPSKPLPAAVQDTVYNNHQGAGWLAMSGNDALCWMRAWLGSASRATSAPGLPLSAAGCERLLQPVVNIAPADAGLWLAPPGSDRAAYGWGWGHAHWRGLHLMQHSGASIGCTAQITLVPELGLGITTFLSGGNLYRAALHLALLEAVLDLPSALDWQAWLRLGDDALAAVSAPDASPAPAAGSAAPVATEAIVGRWFAPGCGRASISAAADGHIELDFDDAPHWRCRLHPRGGRHFATELLAANDGLRFMQARPVGRFEPAQGLAQRFEHPHLEQLHRLDAG
jgi:CubicO group peptidase (beta-lactamase class C family)